MHLGENYYIHDFIIFFKPESPDRKESDERLEMLDEISGGKTFFVKDGM